MLNKMKRILALVMSIMMITSSMPVSALAADSNPISFNVDDTDTSKLNYLTAVETNISLFQGQSMTFYYYSNSGNSLQYQGDGNNGWNTKDVATVTEGERDTSVEKNGYYLTPITVKAAEDKTGTAVYINYGCLLENGTSGKVTITLTVSEAKNTITYHANNGTGESNTATVGDSVTLPADGYTNGDYVLYGWSESADTNYLTGTYYAPGATVTGIDGDKDFYAVWGPLVTISFDANRGTGTVTGTEAKANTTYIIPGKDGLTAPEGECFFGWSTSPETAYTDTENIVVPGKEITLTEDTTYYAVWQPQVTVSYELNGATGTAPEGKKDDPGFEITIAGTDGITAPAKKLFAGWATDAAGTELLQPGAPLTINANTTLYAIWVDTATAIFVNTGDDLSGLSQTVAAGEEITMPSGADLTKPSSEQDLSFYGWKTADQTANTEAETGYYVPGEKVTLEADTEFAAVWGPSKLKISVNKNYYYYDVNAKGYKLNETETDVLKEHVEAYTATAKDYPVNVMQLNSDMPTCDAEGAVIEAGAVTFDTTNANMSDKYNGVVNVNFYYDAYYNISYRVVLPEGYDNPEHKRVHENGVVGVFKYGDYMLNLAQVPVDEATPKYDTFSNAISSTYTNKPANTTSLYSNTPSKKTYSDYAEPGVQHTLNDNVQPKPGATLYYYFGMESNKNTANITFASYYLNMFNSGMQDKGFWENMVDDIGHVYLYYGETVTVSFPGTRYNYIPANSSSKSVLQYYKDSDFYLWKYGGDMTHGANKPENTTVATINTYSDFLLSGVPLVYTGGFDTYGNMRIPLLYLNKKPVLLSVEYYLDGYQIGETEWYLAGGDKRQEVITKDLPEVAQEEVWAMRAFDPLDYSETDRSEVYGSLASLVTGVPYSKFKMVDRHIKFYATTKTPKTTASVTKIWNDNNNSDGLRPEFLEVELNNGAVVTLAEGNNWSYTATGLRKNSNSPVYDYHWNESANDGKGAWVAEKPVEDVNAELIPIEYFWTEKNVPEGYTMSASTNKNADESFSTTITNSCGTSKVSVQVTKVWSDADNQDGIRPSSVTVQLKANGENLGAPVTLPHNGSWSYTWSDLDQMANGENIAYTVDETAVPEGYTKSITGNAAEGFTITNSHTPEKINVTVTKIWDDASNRDNVRPDAITLLLMNGNVEVASETVTVPAGDSFTYTFENVAKKANGEDIVYTVDEVLSDAAAEKYNKTLNRLTVTNSLKPGSLKIIKTFTGKPEGMDFSGIEFTVVGPDGNERKVTYSDLVNNEITISGLVPGEYTVVESGAEIVGYDLTVTNNNAKANVTAAGEAVVTINNAYAQQLTSVSATKVWDDNNNQDGKRENVVLHLTKKVGEGNAAVVDGQEKNIAKDATGDALTVTWTNLPKFEGGVEIIYSVTEEEVAGYTTNITGDAKTGFTVTNKHTPDKADVIVKKVWDDANNAAGFRPTNVTIELYADGVYVDKATLSGSGNEWSHTFQKLPVYENGTVITYTVDEVLNEAAALKYTKSLDQDTLTVTNSYTPETTKATVAKVWTDNNNQDGKRPTELKVTLSNGNTVTLNEANGWTATVNNLPKYANGQEIEYTWSEGTVSEYELTNTSKTGTVTTLTNTHTPAIIAIGVTKAWDDANDAAGFRPDSVTVRLLENGTEVKSAELNAGNGWKVEWIGLPEYKEGQRITYSVIEDKVAEYQTPTITSNYRETKDGWDFTITNTHVPEKTEATVLKVWNDGENRDGKRPESLIVKLLADNEDTGKTVTLSESNKWTDTISELPKYADGKEIKYTWSEIVPEEYTKTVPDGIDGTKTTITNSYTPGETSVTVTKSWDDANNQDGIRPTSVQVQLYAGNETKGEAVMLTAPDWSYTWHELPLKAAGKDIIYTVDETAVPDGYEKVQIGTKDNNYTIKNSHIPATTEVTVKKIWNDNGNQDGIRPDSVELRLYADGAPYGEKFALTGEGDEWSEKITGLPKYNGVKDKAIVWTVKEVTAPDGYDEPTYSADGLTVTNKHTPYTTEATVIKEWDDANNQDAIRPTSLTIKLLADEKETGKSVTLPVDGKWEATLTGLPLKAAGEEIEYTWQEDMSALPEGYELTGNVTANGVTTLTNSYDPETTEVTVKKVWEDNGNQDGKRPGSITVQLKKDGEDYRTATLTAPETGDQNTWSYTFENLPRFDHSTTPIVWTVDEVNVPGGYESAQSKGENGEIVITNTHQPEKTTVEVTKIWNDANNQDGKRPESITVRLYADEVELADKKATITADSADENGNWKYIFTDLPKFAAGKEIDYTISEDTVTNYSTSIDGYVITNTHTPETVKVQVTKSWDDDGNRDGIRPANVTVQLMAGIEAQGSAVTLDASNSWHYEWTDLPKNSTGTPIAYTVAETTVPSGYTAKVTGSIEGGFLITNTHTPATTVVTANKVWDDSNNQDGKRTAVTLTLYKTVDGETTAVGSKNIPADATGDALTVKWDNLFVKENGVDIVYTVTEDKVAGYSTEITGNAKNGFTVTNKHTPEEITISGVKEWDDTDDQDGLRPGVVTINIKLGDEVKKSVQATKEGEWAWSATLPKYANGDELVYTVEEVLDEDIAEAYTSDIIKNENGTYTIKNTHDPYTTTISGIKKWEDEENQDGIRPASVTIELYADGAETPYATTTATAEDGWTWSFADLPVNKRTAAGVAPITYTVKEANVPAGYISAQSKDEQTGVITITNTHTPETINISGIKTWDDNDNQDGKRPGKITVYLLADGQPTGKSAEVTGEGNEWSYTFADVPKYQTGAVKQEIKYSVSEEQVNGYTASYSGMNITNSYTPGKVNFAGTKVWDDANDQDGARPESITIHLWKTVDNVSSDTGKYVTLTNETSWSFIELPEYEDGKLVTYYVQEDAVEGYKTTYSTDYKTITNKHTPATIDISGTKTWEDNGDQDGKRPGSITVQLKADGVALADKKVTVTPDTEGKWEYSFTGLPKYRDHGVEIKYSIEEIVVPGYDTSYDGFNITNKHDIEKVSISGTKVWDDAENQDGKRPGSITINLKVGNDVLATKEVSEVNGKWEFSFTDLDKYEEGEEIAYSIEEIAVTGYETTGEELVWDETKTEATVELVNTHEPATTEIKVTKSWVDNENQDGKRPANIKVQLLANGTQVKEATFGADGVWEYTFTELPKYADGTEIVYTVTETPVDEYTTEIDGLAITNTHTPEETVVNVTKTWDDANDQDGLRPDSITVRLYADGNELKGKVATITAESADADGNWTHSFTGLPKYRNGGTEIVYTIGEDEVKYYTTNITGDVTNGYTIINSHTPATVEVEGTKTWDDANDQDGLRPGSIIVQLLADGKVKETKTVTAENEWKYSFTDLPEFKVDENGKGGNAIAYTVKEVVDEDTAKAYTSKVTGYNIKNTHTPEVVTVEGTKAWNDESNRDGKRPTEIIINLWADDTVKESKTVTANDGWAWKWENLPKYKFNENGEGGKEIVYTITENKVNFYGEPSYDGYNVTNTHEIEKSVTVEGKKDWNDFDNVAGLRPESITINLLADGEVIDSKTVTEKENWAWKWENLPKYAANKVGEEINYTITENAVDNYTTQVQDYNVKNTYTPGKTSVSVTKVWNDDSNRDGLRPASIIVKLLADGDEYKTAELNADNNWSATFSDLLINKKGTVDEPVDYTVAEDQVDGYKLPVITGNATEGYTITNTHDIATTKVEGTKVWEDKNDQDGIRAKSVTIRLLADGTPVEGKVATVNEASEWKFSFTDLPVNRNDNGTIKQIVYTVSEDPVEGYKASITGNAATGFTVTNTHTPEKTEVSVTKVWKDENNQDGLRPSKITIILAANGQAVASKEVTAEDGWNWKFEQLAKYAGGKEIDYTVEELTVSGYETKITGTAAGGYTITNTHTPGVTSVSGTKTWDDADNQDGKRPASITVNLLADGEINKTATVTAENGWKYSFTDLPTHADGEEITYSVEEVLEGEDAKNYTPSYTPTENGYDITNTHEVEKTKVKVTKVWSDKGNQDNKRTASVTINLLADGEATGKSVELNEANDWTYTFENLDKYSKGEEIEYTVEEATVPTGYTVAVTGDAANGYTVTNTHDIDTTEVKGAKTWTDNDDQDGKRPESITVRLLADDVEIDSATVTADNGWNWSFENLPVNKAGEVGKAIVYTITEDEVEGYTTNVDGYNIINTHESEKVAINGTKEWQDANDQDGLRPDSITINLLKNDKAFKNTTTDAEKGWKWSFTDLDKYEKGEEITYTVKESAVEGYTTTGEELVWNETKPEATVELVNTHVPATTEIKVTKTWDDNENQDGKRPANIKVQLLANGTQMDEAIIVDQNGKWEHTFTNLPVKEAGEDIAYTITETAVEDYTTDITGNATDGFAITNTHKIIKTSVSGEKIWSDAENQDGKRPTSITVNLLADGTEIKETKVAADVNGDWNFSFTDLDAYANGKLITYTVTEDPVAEYSTEIEADEETGFITITNSYTPGKTSISGVKVWDDADDQDGLRPDSITVNLVATVESINYRKVAQSATVSAEVNWKYSFEDLPTHVAGKEIEYTVEEVLPENLKDIYTSKVEGTTITNKHTPATTKVSGEKFWDDADNQDGKRPESITVNLLADGEKVKSATVTADGNGKWLYTFENLPVNKAGKAIEYTVEEDLSEELKDIYTSKVEGNNITNIHTPETTKISGVKTWNDADNQDGKRPASITVNLLVVKGENEFELITSKTVTATDNWEYTFDNLPVYAKGEMITYKVTEVAVTDYTADYEGYNITNTYEVEKISISGQKTWDDLDNVKGFRPASITVKVMNGNEVVATKTVTKADGWKYTFTDLDKYAGGEEIEYTVVEDAVDGYTATVNNYDIHNKAFLPDIEVIKTSNVAEDETVGLDEVIEYTITVTNKGNVPFTNVKVVDEMTKNEWTIPELPVGDTKTFTTTYKVTSDDILKGEVLNVVTAKGDPIPDPDPDKPDYTPEDEDDEKDPTDEIDTTLEVIKTSKYDGETVGLDEVINYTITVTNKGNVPFTNVKVVDEMTKNEWTIPELPVGKTETFTTTYTVTSDDILKGEVLNVVTAKGDPIPDPNPDKPAHTPKDDAEVTDPTDEIDTTLKVTKTSKYDGDTVGLDEVITYTITVTNKGNVPFTNVKVDDEKTNMHVVITTLAVGETRTFVTTYKATAEDILNGSVVNIVTAKGDPIPDPNPDKPAHTPKDDAEVTDPTDEIDTTLEVTKTSKYDGETVGLDEVITYTITVTNKGNVPFTNVKVVDEMTKNEWTIPELPVGKTETFTTTYTVTSDDILKGEVLNVVTAKGDPIPDPNPDKPTHTPKDDAEVTDPTDEIDTTLEVTKTSKYDGDTVGLDEVITYTITVTNKGNVPFTNVKVVDEMTKNEWTIPELPVGDTKTFTTTYTVTSDDILKGEVLNVVTAKGDPIPDPDPDKPDYTPEDEDDEKDPTDEIDTTLEVTKTSKYDGETVGLDEVITYIITVTNKGNVPFTNVKVVDEMTKNEWTIPELPVGKTETFTTTYTVTSDDILKGEVLNVVTAKGDPIPDPDPDKPAHTPKDDAEVTDPTDEIDTTLEVTKTSKYDGETVGLDEVITYTITVTNKGNVPFTNVKVVDEMTKNEWTIPELPVGKTETFTTTYTVTSDDILKGEVLNVVTAKGDPIPDPDPKNPPHIPEGGDEEDDPTDPIDTTLTVIKTSDKQGQQVKLGEKITYTITVINDGNVPYTNVEVVDELTGDKWTIEELPVGATETFTAEYTVTSDDILAGTVLNSVTAKGDEIPDPDPENPPHIPEGDDDEEDDPEPIDTTLTVVKTSDVTTTAQVGDTITYTIVVKNDGNVDYTNVKVDDELTGLHETIEVLKVGESQTFTTTRVVTAADAAAGHILNVAVAKADPIPDPDNPDQPKVPEGSDDEDDPIDPMPVVPELYRVTVRYWYEYVGGEVAAKTFTKQYATGDPYAITSPKIRGYEPDIYRVTGVMEKQDMVYDVIYTAKEYKLTIEYIYLDGSEAAPTYTETLKAGDVYDVDSPVIDGYRASLKEVKGWMPARDIKYTVVYVRRGNGWIFIDDYDTPLGIGNVHLNAGECFE